MTEVRKKKEKLSKQTIGFLFKNGRSFRDGKFVLRWDFRRSGVPLFCVTTRKKCMVSAVKRNRMRRLAREFFRKNQAQIRAGARVVLQLGEFSDVTFSEFEKSISKIFRSAGLMTHETIRDSAD